MRDRRFAYRALPESERLLPFARFVGLDASGPFDVDELERWLRQAAGPQVQARMPDVTFD